MWTASQLRDGVQRDLDDSDQVRESRRQVVHQQDDRREAGEGQGGQEEEETESWSCRS